MHKLALNEESVAELYRGYANKFPLFDEFWTSLATDEMKHASWIRHMDEIAETQAVTILENRFNPTAVQSMTDYLKTELNRLNNQNISLIEALSITMSIEQSLIESRFFETFQVDPTELKRILTEIHDDTTAHRNKAKETLEKYRGTGN